MTIKRRDIYLAALGSYRRPGNFQDKARRGRFQRYKQPPCRDSDAFASDLAKNPQLTKNFLFYNIFPLCYEPLNIMIKLPEGDWASCRVILSGAR